MDNTPLYDAWHSRLVRFLGVRGRSSELARVYAAAYGTEEHAAKVKISSIHNGRSKPNAETLLFLDQQMESLESSELLDPPTPRKKAKKVS